MKKMKENKEFVHEKYLGELEAHAKTLLEICEDYCKEIGKFVAADDGIEAGIIAQKDAEKGMLMAIIRYILDYYLNITVRK